jgi:hypothetical protein
LGGSAGDWPAIPVIHNKHFLQDLISEIVILLKPKKQSECFRLVRLLVLPGDLDLL